jgi:mRNA interferase MazF
MVDSEYIPDRGDIIWLDFNPQAGREQRGRRPAFVVSTKNYNAKTSLALLCPITSQIKGYPFEVHLTSGMKTDGAIISDQVKSLDWRARNAGFVEKAGKQITEQVIHKISLLIQ